MSTKSVVVGLVMVLASTMGCGAPPDGDELDDEEASSSEVSSAFMPVDDAPSLPAPQLPRLEQWVTRPPIWDLQHYFEELQQPRFGNCYMYWLKLREPSGAIKEVPVTVCK